MCFHQHTQFCISHEDMHLQLSLTPTLPTFSCSGAKFQRLKQRADEEAGFAKYEPFLIQSKNIP